MTYSSEDLTTTNGLPESLTLLGFSDPAVDTTGFRPTDTYTEWVWLPVIGPSALWMWRRMVHHLPAFGSASVTVATEDLVEAIGLGATRGRHSAGARTLNRLAAFDVVKRGGRDGDLIAVRRFVPLVPAGRVAKLPPSARRAHELLAGQR